MVKLLDISSVCQLISKVGYTKLIQQLLTYLEQDFANWQLFNNIPRPAAHVAGGVIELMPVWNEQFYAYKYVNGHPGNPDLGKLTVAAMGQLSDVKTGYPLLITEMTLLTAVRTAAVAALGSKLLARAESSTLAIIGTGAQSEFQALAQMAVLPIKTIKYYDPLPEAMQKFSDNLQGYDVELLACDSVDAVITDADVIVTLTAAKAKNQILTAKQIKPGVHINAMGGDCPGKTELASEILQQAKVVIEFFEQSFIEGEIQHFSEAEAKNIVHAELHQIIRQQKTGRENPEEITVFDSVGIGLEDFSTLRLVYDLCQQHNYATELDLIPEPDDPRNLFQFIK